MTTITNGYTSLMSGFRQNWLSGSLSSIPVLFRNEKAKPPENSPWVECDVVWGNGEYLALDSTAIGGSLVVQVYTPKGQGTYSSSLVSDNVRQSILSMSFSPFRFEVPSGPVGVPNDSVWFQRVITVPFQMEADSI